MTCIMWLAARPPCSAGQPSVSPPLAASFLWNSRRTSQRASPPSPSAPTPPTCPQSAGSSDFRKARISLRNFSSSGAKRNSIGPPPERRQVYLISEQRSVVSRETAARNRPCSTMERLRGDGGHGGACARSRFLHGRRRLAGERRSRPITLCHALSFAASFSLAYADSVPQAR